jgi:hypothetical protein
LTETSDASAFNQHIRQLHKSILQGGEKIIQNMLAFRTLTNSDHRILQKVRFFGKTNRLENSQKHFDQSRKRQTSLNLKLTIRKFYSKKCVQRMKRIAED